MNPTISEKPTINLKIKPADIIIESAVESLEQYDIVETAVESLEQHVIVESAVESLEKHDVVETAVESLEQYDIAETAVESLEQYDMVDTQVESLEQQNMVETAVKLWKGQETKAESPQLSTEVCDFSVIPDWVSVENQKNFLNSTVELIKKIDKSYSQGAFFIQGNNIKFTKDPDMSNIMMRPKYEVLKTDQTDSTSKAPMEHKEKIGAKSLADKSTETI